MNRISVTARVYASPASVWQAAKRPATDTAAATPMGDRAMLVADLAEIARSR
jgi:hypothetical protein